MEEKKKTQFCKNCGKEISSEAVMCPGCGTATKSKTKKPIHKKWWFWVIIGVVAIGIIGSSSGDEDTNTGTSSTENKVTKSVPVQEEIVYTAYDVSELVDDLENNALGAEKKYDGQYVELRGKLSTIDSDGSYISLNPTNNEFNFINVQCYTKNDDQINQIAQMSKGDIITVRGKITDVGEILGYQLDIDSIN